MNKYDCVLLDLSPLLYRAHYGREQVGKNTIAYRCIKYVYSIMDLTKPKYFAVTVDGDRDKLRRKQVYPEYKSNRRNKPKEFNAQLKIIKEFLDLCNISYVYHPSSESDDSQASLAKMFSENNIKTLLLTSDKDMIQCKNEYVDVGRITKDSFTLLTDEDFPVDPMSFIEYQGLAGDPCDNIKGVKGIGKKTAKELIDEYKTIENVYNNLEKLPKRYQNKLRGNIENAKLARWLAKLYTKVPVGKISDYTYHVNYDLCYNWLEENDFHIMLFRKMVRVSDLELDF